MAVSAWLGASFPAGRPVLALTCAAVLVVACRRPLLVLVLCGLLAQGLAARAADGMDVVTGAPVDGRLTLRTDPAPDELGRIWRAEVSHSGRRWQLTVATDLVTDEFAGALAGDRVAVRGITAPLGWGSRWLGTRHVVGAIEVAHLGDVSAGSALHEFANGVRTRVTEGATSLGDRRQALFVGFVLGDDRFQDPVDAVSFRRAGLTHLLAVSGQNVAFVLALLGPVLRRLASGWRFGLTLAVIAMFALITRFEPSVLRASVMAAVAASAVTVGREASSIRVLALTVSALVLVDPFLVDSVGFRLSVAASAGILLLSGPIARRIPGPRPIALAIAVTGGAQLGVAPFLLATFGPVPVASVPANLLAGPAAGPVMMWGMSAGLVAGFVPGLAPVIHRLTGALLGWIEWVAREIPEVFGGSVDARRLALGGIIATLLLVAARCGRRVMRAGLAMGLAAVLLLPSGRPVRSAWEAHPAAGITVWLASDGTTVVAVDGRARPERTLSALSELGIAGIDVLIGRSTNPAVRATIDAVEVDRGARFVVTPEGVDDQMVGRVGCVDLRLEADEQAVAVAVVHVVGPGCIGPGE